MACQRIKKIIGEIGNNVNNSVKYKRTKSMLEHILQSAQNLFYIYKIFYCAFNETKKKSFHNQLLPENHIINLEEHCLKQNELKCKMTRNSPN